MGNDITVHLNRLRTSWSYEPLIDYPLSYNCGSKSFDASSNSSSMAFAFRGRMAISSNIRACKAMFLPPLTLHTAHLAAQMGIRSRRHIAQTAVWTIVIIIQASAINNILYFVQMQEQVAVH